MWILIFSLLQFSTVPKLLAQEGELLIPLTNDEISRTFANGNNLDIFYKFPGLSYTGKVVTSGSFTRIFARGHFPSSEIGMPELPVYSAILKYSSPQDLSYTIGQVKSTQIVLENFGINNLIYPTQPDQSKKPADQPRGFVINSTEYSRNAFLHLDTVTIEFIGISRGEYLYGVTISPVRYNPGRGVLDIITSAEITIRPKGTHLPTLKSSNLVPSMSLVSGFNSSEVVPEFSDSPQRMIILTDTIFRPHLSKFINWKNQKGIECIVLYKGVNYAGTTFETLRDSIKSTYQRLATTGSPPAWLLIIGDLGIIPRSGGTSNLSDLYYAEMDGGTDFIPEMYSGRLPVSDTVELKNLLNRIIRYEKSDFGSDTTFLRKSLITAGSDQVYATHMNGQVNYASDYYLNTSNSIVNHKFTYPQSEASDDTIRGLINSGISFINYTGHGTPNGWLDPLFSVSDVVAMTNHNKPSFIITNACETAKLSSSPNFGTELVTHPTGGAIGFIGCTNDSYWKEDFYWATGVGNPVINPEYNETGLGIYDRWFHTFGESPSEWYRSMGQINYAGNMSVTASTSLLKKYYWETYILLGDPSLTPVTGKLSDIKVDIDTLIPPGLRSVSLTLPPFSYAAISDFTNLWDAAHADQNGNVTLSLPQLTGDSALLVVTGQNMRTIQKTVRFNPINDKYLVIDSISIDDSAGNGNGLADYGEEFSFDITLKNIGLTGADNVWLKITSGSSHLSVIADSVSVGVVAGESTLILSNVFSLKCSNTTPDLVRAGIVISIITPTDTSLFTRSITLHAPELMLSTYLIDDSQWGNDNHLADPGEKVVLRFAVINSGSSDASGLLTLSATPSGLLFEESSIATGILSSGALTYIPVTVTIPAGSLPGANYTLSCQLTTIHSGILKDYNLPTGMTVESFEHQSFSVFPWVNNHAKPWTITGLHAYDGVYSARSAVITDFEESKISIMVNTPVADTLEYRLKVSSEAGYDYLYFYQNGAEKFKESGEKEWMLKKTPLLPGANRLEWIYKKDKSLSSGMDAAWIDLVTFPPRSLMAKDLKAMKITAPAGGQNLGANEVIKAKFLNLGRDTVTSFGAEYSINSATPVFEIFTRVIAPMDSAEVQFITTADMSAGGTYNIVVCSLLPDDTYAHNDTAQLVLVKTGSEDENYPEKPATIRPNPFHNEFEIVLSQRADVEVSIQITDISGKIIWNRKIVTSGGESIIPVSLAGHAAGIYYIHLKSSEFSEYITIVKTSR